MQASPFKKRGSKKDCGRSQIWRTVCHMYGSPGRQRGPYSQSQWRPLYRRTKLTDDLHEVSGFRTDYQFLTRQKMREIQKLSKGRG